MATQNAAAVQPSLFYVYGPAKTPLYNVADRFRVQIFPFNFGFLIINV